mgnify:CR=1 FL=1
MIYKRPKTKLVTLKIPESLINDLDKLVASGKYSSRSEAIRKAVCELLKRELWNRE